MQRHSFAALAALFTFLTVSAWAADITGAWAGSIASPNGDFALTYTFQQDGAKFTGTVTSAQGGDPLPLVDCKLDGDKISFAVKVDMGGNVTTFSSKGVIKGDEIALTMTNDAGMDFPGQVTIKRQK